MHTAWGGSARPSQLQLPAVLQASCTPTVESGIIKLLKLQDPLLVKGGFNRPNIQYTVRTAHAARRSRPGAAEQGQQGVGTCGMHKHAVAAQLPARSAAQETCSDGLLPLLVRPSIAHSANSNSAGCADCARHAAGLQ